MDVPASPVVEDSKPPNNLPFFSRTSEKVKYQSMKLLSISLIRVQSYKLRDSNL